MPNTSESVISAAFVEAGETGEATPVTLENPALTLSVQVLEDGTRTLHLTGSESDGVRAAVLAGFKHWQTVRNGENKTLTETAEEPAPVKAAPTSTRVPAGPLPPFTPGRPLPQSGTPGTGTLYHGYTPSGAIFTVIRCDETRTEWRCDALDVCVTEADNQSWRAFRAWQARAE